MMAPPRQDIQPKRSRMKAPDFVCHTGIIAKRRVIAFDDFVAVAGSLNASLAQWLIGTGVAPSSYVASQGSALGRMGRVHVEQDGPEVWIGGAVTTCIKGTLTL